jgi:O-antigen/teichoic acid export membrane protein
MAYLYSALASIIMAIRDHRLSISNVSHGLIALLASLYAFWAMFGAGQGLIFYVTMVIFATAFLYLGTCRKQLIMNNEK